MILSFYFVLLFSTRCRTRKEGSMPTIRSCARINEKLSSEHRECHVKNTTPLTLTSSRTPRPSHRSTRRVEPLSSASIDTERDSKIALRRELDVNIELIKRSVNAYIWSTLNWNQVLKPGFSTGIEEVLWLWNKLIASSLPGLFANIGSQQNTAGAGGGKQCRDDYNWRDITSIEIFQLIGISSLK